MRAGRAPGGRVVTWSVAVAPVWFGAVSATYPEHLASLGLRMGVAWIVWGSVFAIAAEVRRGVRNR